MHDTANELSDLTLRDLRGAFLPQVRGMEKAFLLINLIMLGVMALTDRPHHYILLIVFLGAWFTLRSWFQKGPGIPVFPMVGLLYYVEFGLPAFVNNEANQRYPDFAFHDSAWMLGLFYLSAIISYHLFLSSQRPIPQFIRSRSFAQEGDEEDRSKDRVLHGIGFFVLFSSVAWSVAESLGMTRIVFQILPGTFYPVIRTGVEGLTILGCFILGTAIAQKKLAFTGASVFWLLYAAKLTFFFSSVLLSSATGMVFATFVALTLGSGKIPWRFLTVIVVVVGFLNLGKFEMRERYWEGGHTRSPELTEFPNYFAEWAGYSSEILFARLGIDNPDNPGVHDNEKEGQTLLERINSLQNTLFIAETLETGYTPLLMGDTYTLIPKLLIPRFLWPNKPIAHEGQILLSLHYGRQTAEHAKTTYVAWGLIAEAVGNFGVIPGSLFIGALLGLFIAWLERWSAPHLVFSLQGVLALGLTLKLLVSFGMVASVFITSTFQFCMALGVGLLVVTKSVVHATQSMEPAPSEEDPSDPLCDHRSA